MSTRLSGLPRRTDLTVDVHTLSNLLCYGAVAALTFHVCTVLVVNAPSGPSAGPIVLSTTIATVLAAAALLAFGVDAAPQTTGIGLLFAGVFGLLGAVAPAAAVPATVAIGGGTAVFAATHHESIERLQGAVIVVLVATLCLSLVVGITGVVAARQATSTLSLLALAVTPVFAGTDTRSLLFAVAAGSVVMGLGLTLPFVTGAMTLVGTGAVGVSLPVLALAVAGVVMTASAAVRFRHWSLLAGVSLLALAGAPTTISRAVPFALGVAMLVRREVDR